MWLGIRIQLLYIDVETLQSPRPMDVEARRPVPTVCRILCKYVRGMDGNPSDRIVVSSQYDRLLCSETLVSVMRNVTELLVPAFGCPVVMPGHDASGPWEGCIHSGWM